MKVVMLTTDARECFREYAKNEPYFGAPQEALFQAVPRLADVEMHVISCWQRPLPAPSRLAPNIWFHGLVVPRLGWMRTGYQGCIRAVRQKLKELRPDIVHGQGTERDCAICAAFSGVPNVVTIHGNMEALSNLLSARVGSYLWCAGKLENFTLRRTGGVFCNSAYTEELVAPRARRTWRVANPIREQFFSAPLPATRSPKNILVNVGVVSERKRQLELLRLARELHLKNLEFEFHFVGKAETHSPYVRQFLEEIKPAEKAGYARYVGMKSVTELVECFDQASAMIHFPSEEAFGLVVVEGLARNLKFFGSKVGGIVDIVSAVDGAELYAEQDWRGLAGAIEKWIRGGLRLPKTAAVVMAERYHPRVIARQHLDTYEEFLSKRS